MADAADIWGPQTAGPYYLGSKTAAPTSTNQGTTLDSTHTGYTYWNSTTTNQWVWTGTAWREIDAPTVIQVVEATPITTYSSHTTQIPLDDTIPQITEGEELITAVITPTSTASRLVITASIPVMNLSAINTFALFQDAILNALAVAITGTVGAALVLRHEMVAGTLSTITFRLRAGPSTATTLYINGGSAARYFGGIAGVRLKVEEIKV